VYLLLAEVDIPGAIGGSTGFIAVALVLYKWWRESKKDNTEYEDKIRKASQEQWDKDREAIRIESKEITDAWKKQVDDLKEEKRQDNREHNKQMLRLERQIQQQAIRIDILEAKEKECQEILKKMQSDQKR
jgi:transketolase